MACDGDSVVTWLESRLENAILRLETAWAVSRGGGAAAPSENSGPSVGPNEVHDKAY